MPDGPLPFTWVVPYPDRHPAEKGRGQPQDPRNERRGPDGQWFEATPPLRGTTMEPGRIRELVQKGLLEYVSLYPSSGWSPHVT